MKISRIAKNRMLLVVAVVVACSIAGISTIYPSESKDNVQKIKSPISTDRGTINQAVTTDSVTEVQSSTSTDSPMSSTSTPSNKPYVAGLCTRTPIPRSTDIQYVDYLYEDEEKMSPVSGHDGYLETCTADSRGYKLSDYRREPYNDLLYVGTKKRPATTAPSTGYTYSEAYQLAVNNCGVLGTANTGAYTQCISAYLSKYGY